MGVVTPSSPPANKSSDVAAAGYGPGGVKASPLRDASPAVRANVGTVTTLSCTVIDDAGKAALCAAWSSPQSVGILFGDDENGKLF